MIYTVTSGYFTLHFKAKYLHMKGREMKVILIKKNESLLILLCRSYLHIYFVVPAVNLTESARCGFLMRLFQMR